MKNKIKHRHLISLLSLAALIVSIFGNSAYAITFTPPSRNSAPRTATGGASRGSFFTPRSGNGAPRTATGGASRGSFFTPRSGNGAPRTATGGASRGNLFTPQGAPRTATGGASRGNLFTPQGAPRTATGGASRGNLFTPQGAPKQAAGGASRVGTYHLNPSTVAATGPAALIGLMPQSYYGTTISERPTFLVYLPASNAQEAVFSIKDETGNMHYQMTIPVAAKSGVMAVSLPEQAPALAIGKNYQWFLALKIDGELSPSTPFIDGWVERIQANAEVLKAMQQADKLEQAKALGKSGVWYDCVAQLAALHNSQTNNPTIAKQWQELLTSVGLKDIVKAPLVASVK